MKPPSFWFHKETKSNIAKTCLSPAGGLYHYLTCHRQRKAPGFQADIPVMCVGNISLGGSGKTPTVVSLAQYLRQNGYHPAIISRGYSGSEKGPYQVQMQDLAHHVGDEPLLLCQAAPCYIGRDRRLTAEMAQQRGADILIMDDGFQNPTLAKDISILVFDGAVGLGNGAVFPAGPLRQSLQTALPRADLCLIIGEDQTNLKARIQAIRPDMPCQNAVITAEIEASMLADLRQTEIFAFAGIGRPAKFYDSLADLSLNVTGTEDFADHHGYSLSDLERLAAKAAGRRLLTTEKDWVRLPMAWRQKIEYIAITLTGASGDIWSVPFSSWQAKLRDFQ